MTNQDRSYAIACIPGDGIGPETVAAARRVLDVVADDAGFRFEWQEYPWGCDYYLATGSMMDEDGLSALSSADAILLGAVGRPDVPDHISLWGLLIPIRRGFDQYVSLRPVRLLDGVDGDDARVAQPGGIACLAEHGVVAAGSPRHGLDRQRCGAGLVDEAHLLRWRR